jgi:ribonuclease R
VKSLRAQVEVVLRSASPRTVRVMDIVRQLGLRPDQRRLVRRVLRELVREGKLYQFTGRRYGIIGAPEIVTGTLEIAAKGYGFVRVHSHKETERMADVFIARRNLGTAMHGDTVAVRVVRREGEKPEGRVVEVLERGRTTLVGQFHYAKRGGVVIPRDQRFGRSVIISQVPRRLGVKNGDWVVVKILEWTSGRDPLLGTIVEVLGDEQMAPTDILLVVRDYGVEIEFPDAVIQAARQVATPITPEELTRRQDFRQLRTVTIDPVGAKDFDDALSIEVLENGIYRLGVHIADVSHYVTEGSAVDEEALERGTSIYPVDRVIPMLPDVLSSNMCSLRPDEDRLTLSVIIDVDPNGQVRDYRFYEAVIRSRFRMTYEEVEAIFDRSDPWILSKYQSVQEDLFALKVLSDLLRQVRSERGSLDLDVPETEVLFNSVGQVVDVRRKIRLASHRLVEECMVLANEVVAQHLYWLKIPSLYRVHEKPAHEKLERLVPILANLGITYRPSRGNVVAQLQSVLAQAEQLPHGYMVRRLVLRAMMRAQYSAENKGHFGIASSCYTHFTSPIRRYPDLVVHRILRASMRRGGLTEDRQQELEQRMPVIAALATDREERADAIEMEAILVKLLEFMQAFLGEEFEGTVSGVANYGVFVEVDRYPVEGLVPLRNLPGDSYEYDADRLLLKARKRGISFALGRRVLVTLERVDLVNRRMDFGFIKIL